jgi:hypothetical protein
MESNHTPPGYELVAKPRAMEEATPIAMDVRGAAGEASMPPAPPLLLRFRLVQIVRRDPRAAPQHPLARYCVTRR